MKEFTKVSIHNHFGGAGADKLINENYTKSFDFDFNSAYEHIDSAVQNGFELLAMTQANVFNVESYSLVRNYAKKKGVELLPGVELNIKNKESKYLHVVVVFDIKNNLFSIKDCIDKYIYENTENSLTFEQFLNLVVNHKSIIIPHGIKQKDRSAANNPEILSELISLSDSIPVVLEDSQTYHKDMLKARIMDILTKTEFEWIDKAAVVSTADRNDFSEIASPTYIWGAGSFDDLYYSCFMGKTRIKRENDLVKKINYISRIEIISNGKSQIKSTEISCSHGLNTIIGPSGSGKTLLLDIIKKKLTGDGLDNKTISKESDYSSVYNIDDVIIYDRDGLPIDISSGYNIVEGEILYNKVISAYKSDRKTMLKELNIEVDHSEVEILLENFNKSINEYKDNCLRVSKNKMTIKQLLSNVVSTILFLNENSTKINNSISYQKKEYINTLISTKTNALEEITRDFKLMNKGFDDLITLAKKYGFENQFKKEIEPILLKFKNSITIKGKTTKNELESAKRVSDVQNFLFDSVQEYNKKIGQQSALVVERNQELLKQFEIIQGLLFENVLIRKRMKIPVLTKDDIKKAIKINSGTYARLAINEVNLSFEKDNLRNYFYTNIGNSPKINKSKFSKDVYNFEQLDDVKDFLDTFVDNEYTDRLLFSPKVTELMDYNIELKNVENNYEDINSISAGNLGKIYINRMFEEKIESSGSNVIILYDQPDSNMEKAFILNDLGPRLSNLRDKYQVFITTHEPLLVVNADSNNVIAASNNKTAVKPNDIEYVNRSFAGANSKASLILEVAKLIDGSPEAIKQRNTIYGGLLSEN